jgi:hypothetical protein
MTIDDINVVLPIYDQYEFQGGTKMCDNLLAMLLKKARTVYSPYGTAVAVAQSAALCYNLNLEKSKIEAIGFAARCLRGPCAENEEEEKNIRLLLPLIQDDEPTLKFILSTVMGKDENMSMDAMRVAVLEDSFVVAYMLRFEQIMDQEEIIQHLQIKQIHLSDAGWTNVNGVYKKSYPDGHTCGALQLCYEMNEGLVKIVIEAADPFGKTWQIVKKVDDPSDDTFIAERAILYKWKSDFSSLAPPKKGWRAEGGDRLALPSIEYNFYRH